jgi:hypothetical protein
MQLNFIIEPEIKSLNLNGDSTQDLLSNTDEYVDKYRDNLPFPHLVLDGLFPNELLKDILNEVNNFDHSAEKFFYGSVLKNTTSELWKMGPTTRRFLLDLNSSEFCKYLEKLTGIVGLVPDPYYEGGGLHETKAGGFLKVHTDFNWHKKLKLDRRLNMIIYLNDDWDESYGGGLQLWDRNMEQKVTEVSPSFNRSVIFSTTDYSYHGHPDKLKCPDTKSRKSIALYYYTNGRPDHEVKYTNSSDTNYQKRPGEKFSGGNMFSNFKHSLKKFIPPIITELFTKIR